MPLPHEREELRDEQFFPCTHIPDSRRAIEASGGNELAIVAPRNRIDAAFVVKAKELLLNPDGHMTMVWPAIWLQGDSWQEFREWIVNQNVAEIHMLNEEISTFNAATLTAWVRLSTGTSINSVSLNYKHNPIQKNTTISINSNMTMLPYSTIDINIINKIKSKTKVVGFIRPDKIKKVLASGANYKLSAYPSVLNDTTDWEKEIRSPEFEVFFR